LLEVAVKDSPFTISSTKRVAIPVGEATIIEATDRYKLAVTPTQIDESGRVRLEIWDIHCPKLWNSSTGRAR
jgi:hypothetical protein